MFRVPNIRQIRYRTYRIIHNLAGHTHSGGNTRQSCAVTAVAPLAVALYMINGGDILNSLSLIPIYIIFSISTPIFTTHILVTYI